MEFETNYWETKKTARYISYGKLSEQTKFFWFVLHGSQMLAEQMVYKFKDFDPESHFIVAPEALNRFYSKGFGGDVVASWMTKRDRLHEINDFSHYLSGLYNNYSARLTGECKKIILGFSQGGTTAFRWLHDTPVDVNCLVGYSCWIPEDIDLSKSETNLSTLELIYSYGLQDEFLTEERISQITDIVSSNKLDVLQLPYDGKHKVDRDQLKKIFTDYIKK